MDNLEQYKEQIRRYILLVFLGQAIILVAAWFLASQFTSIPPLFIALFTGTFGLLAAFILSGSVTVYVMQPVRGIWQAVLHLSPTQQGYPAPDVKAIHVGRDMVASLTTQLYQLSDIAKQAATEEALEKADLGHNFVAQNLPLPFFALDASETITFANAAAEQYIGIAAKDLVGKNVYMVLDMSFPSNDTFDTWLKGVKTKNATAAGNWERVRLNVRDNHPARLFDLASYYNRDNPNKVETMLVLFDHTEAYSQDEQAVSFIALSVHELRTPLTLLRGYIEVFDEELDTARNPELADFMLKMRSQAEQLMAFVNNILNVARVDDDQLELHLEQGDWPTILKQAIESLSLRAKVRGITLHCRFATNLPPVGVDPLSIQEVVNNLVDNAIKYSGSGKVIDIETHLTPEGLIETTVKDAGLGIPSSIMSNLFTKFYRDHRNRAQIGGTGLGLYLSKAIVDAHGGTIWVRSKENEGSTFGFTLLPYTQIADEKKGGANQDIVRGAHGWIKNHSLYRR